MFNKKTIIIVNIIFYIMFLVYCIVGVSLIGVYIDGEFFKRDIISENVISYSKEFKGENIYYTIKDNKNGSFDIQYVNNDELTEYYYNRVDDIEVYKNGEKILSTNENETLDNEDISEAFNIINIANGEKTVISISFPVLSCIVMFNIINIINIKAPLYFFETRTFLWVKGGEPSDLYIFIRDLGYVLIPVISIILMLINIFDVMF